MERRGYRIYDMFEDLLTTQPQKRLANLKNPHNHEYRDSLRR